MSRLDPVTQTARPRSLTPGRASDPQPNHRLDVAMTTITARAAAPPAIPETMSDRLARMTHLIGEAKAAADGQPGHDAEIIADALRAFRLTHAAMRAIWDEAVAVTLTAGIPRQEEQTP